MKRWFLWVMCLFCTTNACAIWMVETKAVMGTEVRIEIWNEKEEIGRQAIEEAFSEFHRVDQLMSTYLPSSRVSELNRQAGLTSVVVGDEIFSLVTRANEVSGQTNGAFDVTYASVGYYYDLPKHIAPSQQQISRALPLIDFRKIQFTAPDRLFLPIKGMKVDLGGIAKGHTVDRVVAILLNQGILHAAVTAGGDSRFIGDRHGKLWNIGIRHPRDKNKLIMRIPVENLAVSTSGDYERYFEENGQRIHHILNPKTGSPTNELTSVTVIAEDSETADALSTSLFVLGVEEGMRLANKMENVSVIMFDKYGQVHLSQDLQRLNN